jgi:hypothetical protein
MLCYDRAGHHARPREDAGQPHLRPAGASRHQRPRLLAPPFAHACARLLPAAQAILQWFTQHDTSPLTGLSLPTKDLTPNDALKAQIDAFLVANPSVVVIDATGPQ